jgi:predicted acylesterase/phospholipase RssA
MPSPSDGPTAFVLAGGGTKGSFEVGALQYLIGVEGIVPQIVTATSAGAVVATVLAQGRTLSELAERVDEIENDVLAMTGSERVFGKQAWLAALDGTALGRAIERGVTEGTRPPFPLRSQAEHHSSVPPVAAFLAPRVVRRQNRRVRRRRQRHVLRLLAGAGLRLPRVRRRLRTSGSSVLTLEPLAEALRAGADGIRPVDPELVARPGLQLRLAVTAMRAGVLRYVTEDGTIVEADACTPAPAEAAGPVDMIDAVIASASVPLVFPPHPMADDDYVDGGVIEIVPVGAAARLGAKRIIAVVAVPLGLARDERDYAAAPAGDIGLRAMGMIWIADRQRANLGVSLPEGTSLTTIDPVVDVVGLFEVELGLLRINRDYGWLRAADVLAQGDPELLADVAASTHAMVEARCEAWRLEEDLWEGSRSDEAATAGALSLVREQKERVRVAIEQRKQLGFAVPEECEAWWTEFEAHSRPRPEHLPRSPAGPVRAR